MAKNIQPWSDEIKQFIRDNIRHDDQGVLYWKTNRPRAKAGEPIKVTKTQTAPLKGNNQPRYYLQFGFILPSTGKLKALRVHHVVYFLEHGEQAKLNIDHLNGDSLDNRPVNLEDKPTRDNAINKRKCAGCASSFKGVAVSGKIPLSGKPCFAATIGNPTRSGDSIYLKGSKSEAECARAYDLASIVIHDRRNNFRNFPDSDYSPDEIANMRQFLITKRPELAKVLH